MKNQPKISIITVCFNSGTTIEETIHSVLDQEYPNIEYIIIDGGSTDATLSIIERYRGKIHHVVSEPDEGIYDAMNKGIALATGTIIGLLNADDVYAHSKVISQVANAFDDTTMDAVFGDLTYFSKDKNNIVRYWRSCDFKMGLFAKGWNPAHPTFFVKREIYLQYGAFDTSFTMGNDVELMMRFLEKYRIQSRYLPFVLVNMRLGGVSNSSIKSIFEQNWNILQAAKKLNIPISPFMFFFHKLLNRLSQFIFKPGKEYHYAK